MTWMNNDGLFVKFNKELQAVVPGGEYNSLGGRHVYEVIIDYTDVLSASATIVDGSETGSAGVMIPKGLFVEEVEVVTQTAFTSSGTIGSSVMILGLIREDRSTTYTANGFTTASFTGGSLDAAGEKTVLRVGSTGAGAFIGTTLANDGLIVVANSAHASHPYTAGRAVVRVIGYYPQTT